MATRPSRFALQPVVILPPNIVIATNALHSTLHRLSPQAVTCSSIYWPIDKPSKCLNKWGKVNNTWRNRKLQNFTPRISIYFPLISLSQYIEISKILTKPHKINITLLAEHMTLEAKTVTWSNTAVFGNGESCKYHIIGWQGRHRMKTEWSQQEISNYSCMAQYGMYPACNAAKYVFMYKSF